MTCVDVSLLSDILFFFLSKNKKIITNRRRNYTKRISCTPRRSRLNLQSRVRRFSAAHRLLLFLFLFAAMTFFALRSLSTMFLVMMMVLLMLLSVLPTGFVGDRVGRRRDGLFLHRFRRGHHRLDRWGKCRWNIDHIWVRFLFGFRCWCYSPILGRSGSCSTMSISLTLGRGFMHVDDGSLSGLLNSRWRTRRTTSLSRSTRRRSKTNERSIEDADGNAYLRYERFSRLNVGARRVRYEDDERRCRMGDFVRRRSTTRRRLRLRLRRPRWRERDELRESLNPKHMNVLRSPTQLLPARVRRIRWRTRTSSASTRRTLTKRNGDSLRFTLRRSWTHSRLK